MDLFAVKGDSQDRIRAGGADRADLLSGFVLGPWCGVLGTIIGGLIALVIDIFFGAKKKTEAGKNAKSGPIPLIPYLSAGFLISYFVFF